MKNNIGCGKDIFQKYVNGISFICGVPNGNGQERFCKDCDLKMRGVWREQDKINYLKGVENEYNKRKS